MDRWAIVVAVAWRETQLAARRKSAAWPLAAMNDRAGEGPAGPRQPELLVGLNAVILAVTAEQPRVLTVDARELGGDFFGTSPPRAPPALPFGSFDAKNDRTLELCMRRSVLEKTRGERGYVEQI